MVQARRIDGAACAAELKEQLRRRVVALAARGVVPGLGTLLVGEDPGSLRYVAGKRRDCADIVVAAAGQEHFITADMIKPGAVLVDVGVSRGPVNPVTGRSRVQGDLDPGCYEVAGAYTPNPGGVGPMTRAMLLENVVSIAERAAGIPACRGE